PDAAHAGRRPGEDLSRRVEQRAATQVLPAHQSGPGRARRTKGRVEYLRLGRGQVSVGYQARAGCRSRQMTRSEFLDTLRRRLAGMPEAEIDDLIGDYATHFADGIAAGRSE